MVFPHCVSLNADPWFLLSVSNPMVEGWSGHLGGSLKTQKQTAESQNRRIAVGL